MKNIQRALLSHQHHLCDVVSRHRIQSLGRSPLFLSEVPCPHCSAKGLSQNTMLRILLFSGISIFMACLFLYSCFLLNWWSSPFSDIYITALTSFLSAKVNKMKSFNVLSRKGSLPTFNEFISLDPTWSKVIAFSWMLDEFSASPFTMM